MENKLSFLQSQVLEAMYLGINEKGKTPSIAELACVTGYPPNSKILENSISALIKKGFISKNGGEIYTVPENKKIFFTKIIEKHKNKEKFKNHNNYAIDFNNYVQLALKSYTIENSKTILKDLNRQGIVHNWYGYLEDFPYELIKNKLEEYNIHKGMKVLDPFCGSGTTLVTSKILGVDSIGLDANPLMQMVSSVKTYWEFDLTVLKGDILKLIKDLHFGLENLEKITIKNNFIESMPKREINQWLTPRLQREVAFCKDLIENQRHDETKRLFLFALGKSAFDASYVSLCPGTTFYPYRKREPFYDIFCKKLIRIYSDLKTLHNYDSYGHADVFTGDSRFASQYIEENSIDIIITSPPYPNDLEYTRQTRLELYLLDFVKNMDEVRDLKQEMVRGSTKLIYKTDNNEKYITDNELILEVSNKIAHSLRDKNWGFDYPKMVKEYFGDMYLCLNEFYKVLTNGGYCLLVVGDQTYKENIIPVGKILTQIGEKIGYSSQKIELFRMRRSTTHNIPLPEEIVILRK